VAMDLPKILGDLRQQRDKLEQAIATLNSIVVESGGRPVGPPPVKKRRGRKEMGPEERREVSRRMRRYWEKRRNGLSAEG